MRRCLRFELSCSDLKIAGLIIILIMIIILLRVNFLRLSIHELLADM